MRDGIKDKRRRFGGTTGIGYVLPIIFENCISVMGTFIFSAISGKISISSLTAISIMNSLASVLVGALSMVTISSTILTSRYVGAKDRELTSKTIEQSVFLTVVITVSATVLVLVFSKWLCRLLVKSDDAVLAAEALAYMRLLSISVPFFVLYSVFCGVMRSADNSRFPMIVSVVMNVILIAMSYIFIVRCNMGVKGSGLAMLICRAAACFIAGAAVFHERILYKVRFKGLLKPDKEMISNIIKLGMPTTFESLSVQGVYLVVNTMIVAIGTHQAAVYSLTFSIYQMVAALFHTIFSIFTVTYVGHYVGARQYKKAKNCSFKMMLIGVAVIAAFSGLTVIAREYVVPLLSNEAEVINDAKPILWVIIVTGIAGMPSNTTDVALRCGGDTKYVMLYTSLMVWLVRLPLTYVFCFVLELGAMGAFMANFISMFARSACAILRNLGNKWLHVKS